MLNRRQLLGAAAAMGCSLGVPSVFAQGASPVSGKDYTLVRPPLDFGRRPIVVHDFFAYTCPHCLQFEPVMTKFVESMKGVADVRIVPVPVAWNDSYSMFPRAYFSFIALNRLTDLHLPFWEWVIREEHDWKGTEDVENDISKWVVAHGVDAAQWKKTMTSFAVVSKTRSATQTWKNYGVDSTPCIGVAGRYITAPHLTGTRAGTIDVVNFLINQIRNEK